MAKQLPIAKQPVFKELKIHLFFPFKNQPFPLL